MEATYWCVDAFSMLSDMSENRNVINNKSFEVAKTTFVLSDLGGFIS